MKRHSILFVLLNIFLCVMAYGQSKPQIQAESIWAPNDIKIDGVLREWPNKFLTAYNPRCRIYYTICNDENNLYLIVRGLGTRVSSKILHGGITFLINEFGNKKIRQGDSVRKSLTFPLPLTDSIITNVMTPMWSNAGLYKNESAGHEIKDSIEKESNARLLKAIKDIKITGIKQLQDSVISIYNETGIKAMAQFTWIQPVVEVAIPLKYLNQVLKGTTKFTYNIRLNGGVLGKGLEGINLDPDPDNMFIMSPTDFWGNYELAVKP